MINNIVEKIYLKSKDCATNEIIKLYKKKSYCIVNFIYYASANKYIIENFNKDYYNSLINWDFLLPDGIALKIFLKKKFDKNIKENLNWTDFVPYFLSSIKSSRTHIWFYTVYDEKIWKNSTDANKVELYIKNKFNPQKIYKAVSHYNSRWTDFNFKDYENSLKWNFDFKIFLVWLWTPFQEIWIKKNKKFFQKNNILIINVWWLFDFWAWFEKRAPKLIRKLNLEWLWRFGQNPKKNFSKVLESIKLLKNLIN